MWSRSERWLNEDNVNELDPRSMVPHGRCSARGGDLILSFPTPEWLPHPSHKPVHPCHMESAKSYFAPKHCGKVWDTVTISGYDCSVCTGGGMSAKVRSGGRRSSIHKVSFIRIRRRKRSDFVSRLIILACIPPYLERNAARLRVRCDDGRALNPVHANQINCHCFRKYCGEHTPYTLSLP